MISHTQADNLAITLRSLLNSSCVSKMANAKGWLDVFFSIEQLLNVTHIWTQFWWNSRSEIALNERIFYADDHGNLISLYKQCFSTEMWNLVEFENRMRTQILDLFIYFFWPTKIYMYLIYDNHVKSKFFLYHFNPKIRFRTCVIPLCI